MELLPSPMMVRDEEVRGLSYKPQFNPYILRFTPLDDEGNQLYSIESIIEDFLKDNFEIWIVSCETRPKIHFHIYLETQKLLTDLKEDVRIFIYSYYPVRTRGFGTKQYSCLESKDPLNSIIYLLKQRGEYHFSGFIEEFINSCILSSFEKSPNEFEREINDLSQEFMDTNMSPYTYAEQLIILYARYDKRVHFRDIQGIVNSKIVKRDVSKAYDMVLKNLVF